MMKVEFDFTPGDYVITDMGDDGKVKWCCIDTNNVKLYLVRTSKTEHWFKAGELIKRKAVTIKNAHSK